MEQLDLPVMGVGTEALEEYLSSDRAPQGRFLLSRLDGFLAGIVVGPELIPPEEWMPVVWGDEEPTFAGEDEAEAVLGGILSRYNDIVHEVAEGRFEPIFRQASDGAVIAKDWADGFGLAMALRSQAWEPLIGSKRHAVLLIPILTLSDGDGEVEVDPQLEAKVREEAPRIIPACVMGIAEFWIERRAVRRAVRRGPRIGRNGRCPCGSGKKYKQCCGQ